jgi:arylsulfatase A-like enzyme
MGVGVGAAEVALRAQPRLGMSTGDIAAWLLISVVLFASWLIMASGVAWVIGRRCRGLVFSAALVVEVALYYRFELVLNDFLHEPHVWGGLLGIVLGSLLTGLAVDGLLRRFERPLRAGLLAVAALSAVVALVRGQPVDGSPRGDAPNILVITLDTTRPDQLAAYGADNVTPTISRLAAEGVVFEQAISTAPLTEPSHLAILTGIPPYISGVVSNGTALGERPALLSHLLRDNSYITAGFVSGFSLHSKYGWTQGFDMYDDDFGRFRGLHALSLVKMWDQIVLPAHALRERRGDIATGRAVSWLDAHHDERFFMWLHLFDPHAPYEAPAHPFDPPTDGEPLSLPQYWPPPHRAITSASWLEEAYRAEIRYVDALLGELIQAMEGHGVLDDTIIVLTADHGESLTEHDYLFDHGDYLYDASLQVPLIVRFPARAQAGLRVPCQVSNLDVTPTLISLLGIHDDHRRYGQDLSAVLAGSDCQAGAVIATTMGGRFMETPPIDHAIRADAHKFIEKGGGEEQCFDLRTDPGEEEHIGACPAPVQEMLQSALELRGDISSPELDPESEEMLRALGYIE